MVVVLHDIVPGGFPGNVDPTAGGGIADDPYFLARVAAAVAIGLDIDRSDAALGADGIAANLQAIDAAGLVDGDVGVAAVVEQLAVADGAIHMVFVHQPLPVVDLVAAVGSPVAEDLIVIPLDRPTPATHLHGPIIVGRGTRGEVTAGSSGTVDVFSEADDIVGANGSIAGKGNGTAAGHVQIVVADDNAFAEGIWVGLRRTIGWVATTATEGGVVNVEAGTIVVVKNDLGELDTSLLPATFDEVAVHGEIRLARARQSIVGDQAIFCGVHGDGSVMPVGEALPRMLAELLIGHVSIGNRGMGQQAPVDQPLFPGCFVRPRA